MEIFVLQVKAGGEDKFLLAAERMAENLEGVLCFPRRRLPIRKGGKEKIREVPLYGGYLFFQCEELTKESLGIIKTLPGFNRFLPSNDRIIPLLLEEKRFLFTLLSGGDLIGLSRVSFDQDGLISVKEGPLKGYEGKIVKVDKRKRRARVKLDLYSESYLIDFGFEVLQNLE